MSPSKQAKRLVKRWRDQGAEGLISKHRGKIANNRISERVKNKALQCFRATYAEFWKSKVIKKSRVHPSKPKHSQRGEFIQIDGTPHQWFEERADDCRLIVFIDDASSE
jgi:hypothetical protein